MPVDDGELPAAVAGKLLQHVAQRMHQGRALQANRTRHVIATTALLLGLVTIAKRWRDQTADFQSYAAGKLGRQKNIDVQRHVMAVLFHGTQWDKDRSLGIFDALQIVGPRKFRGEGAFFRHGASHWVVS